MNHMLQNLKRTTLEKCRTLPFALGVCLFAGFVVLPACETTQKRPTMTFDEAIRANDPEALQRVLNDRPDQTRDFGPSPQALMLAASLGHTQVLEVLVRADGSLGPYEPPMSTPLHYAAGGGHVETVQWLIDQGAKIDARDEFGKTPMHWTGDSGEIETAILLIDAGADPQAWSRFGTPMALAKKKGHTEYVEILKERGVSR